MPAGSVTFSVDGRASNERQLLVLNGISMFVSSCQALEVLQRGIR